MQVDIHAHLDHSWFKEDLNKVLVNSKDMIIVATGINYETNRSALKLALENKNVLCTLGIYPKEAFDYEKKEYGITEYKDFDIDAELEWMDEQLENHKDKIFGIGEVGLDFVNINEQNEETKERARKDIDLFRDQIKLAKKNNLPIIIHSRKAEDKVIEVLKEEEAEKVILHAFGGSKKLVREANELGFYFSIPPVVTRASHFQMIIKETPIKKLLTETDSPYLGHEKDQRNEPLNVKHSIQKIAEIKDISEEEAERIIYDNFLSLRK